MLLDFYNNDLSSLITKISILTFTFVHFTKFHRFFFSSDLRYGSPMYTWVSTLPVHLVLFPAVLTTSYLSYPSDSVYDWMFQTWCASVPAYGLPYEQFWICSFVAHMLKDFIICPMSTLFVVHHLLAMGIALVFLNTNLHPVIFCLGCTIIELGSATHTLYVLYPKKYLPLYQYGMTLSNSTSFYITSLYIHYNMYNINRLALSFFGFVFIFFRQYYLMYARR